MRLVGSLVACVFAVVGAGVARAATISVDMADDGRAFIKFEGEVKPGDGPAFADVAAKYEKAVVLFDSPGGNMLSGLQIGRVIHQKKYATFSPEGAHCYSICALAWLAGAPRAMQPASVIGFHAAYNGRTHETSGVGNALIGSYLASLEVSDEAIMFMAEKDWSDVNVLTPAIARQLHIAVNILPPAAQISREKRERERFASTDRPKPVETPTFTPFESLPTTPSSSQTSAQPGLTAAPKIARPGDDAPEPRARRFVQEYFAHWSESNAEALGFFTAAYAPQIEFYGQPVDRDLLMEKKRDYAGRWPVRVYAARPDSLAVKCDTGATCIVTGVVDWDCHAGTEGGAHSKGTANFSLTIASTATSEKIVRESGTVIARAVD